jgi:hypothetical protein
MSVRAGALPPLVVLLRSENEGGGVEAVRVAAMAVGNLSVAAHHKALVVEAGALPPLVEAVHNLDDASVHAARAIANVARDKKCRVGGGGEFVTKEAAIVSAGAIPALAELLRSGAPDAQRQVLFLEVTFGVTGLGGRCVGKFELRRRIRIGAAARGLCG